MKYNVRIEALAENVDPGMPARGVTAYEGSANLHMALVNAINAVSAFSQESVIIDMICLLGEWGNWPVDSSVDDESFAKILEAAQRIREAYLRELHSKSR